MNIEQVNSGKTIAKLQNTDRIIIMLSAQSQLYSEAKKLQFLNALICLAIPVVLMLFQVFSIFQLPGALYYIVLELLLFVVGIALSVRFDQKNADAAQIQQDIDLRLYGLEWFEDVRISEEVSKAANRYREAGKDLSKLQNWYDLDLNRLDAIVAIRCCQKTNIMWSFRLGRIWFCSLVLIGLACLVITVLPPVLLKVNWESIFFTTTIIEWISLQCVDGLLCMSQMCKSKHTISTLNVDSIEDVLCMQNLIFDYRKMRFKVPDKLFNATKKRFSSIYNDIQMAEDIKK